MYVEDDPAFPEHSEASDKYAEALDAYRKLRHFSPENPIKQAAWLRLIAAEAKVLEASNKIDPQFKGPKPAL